MSNGRLAKQLSVIAVVCALMGLAVGLLSARMIAGEEYRNMARLMGAAGRLHPSMEDALMQALKEAKASDYAAGDAVLGAYNYGPGTFQDRSVFPMIGWGMLMMLAAGTMAAGWAYHSAKRRESRIGGMSAFLEAANLDRKALLNRQEDEFSRLEDELYKTVTELRQSRERAVRERQSLADNLADISHQLKTPITSMSLMAQLLSDSCRDEETVYLDKLKRQLARLESLVSSLLTLSKLDAGTLSLKREPVQVYAMLARASEPIEEMLQQNGLRLLMPPESDIRFTGDADWTAEAFLNVIKNCCEHTPGGGTISISCSQNPLYAEVIVEDGGAGIDKADLPHIFERFYKGKNAAKDSAGIGLSLAKSIIEKQGGAIRAENGVKGGARFAVKFYA